LVDAVAPPVAVNKEPKDEVPATPPIVIVGKI
jgi:hypothetical protein